MIYYIYALLANFFTGLCTQYFAQASRAISAVWTTVFRNGFYFVMFFISVFFAGGYHAQSAAQISFFMISGFISLGIGDIFLMKAFASIGPGRTLMFYSFHPLLVGLFSFILFGQTMNVYKLLSIIFFIGCIFVFALESYRKGAAGSSKPMLFALTGVFMDAAGMIVSRYGFDYAPIGALEANFYRAAGGLAASVMLCYVLKVNFWTRFRTAGKQTVLSISKGCFFGGLALMLMLAAVKGGHLAAISAISITGVIFAGMFECLFEKKWPSKYLLGAFVLFVTGMTILLGFGN